MPKEVPLSLQSICEGKLEAEFQRLYPGLIEALKHGDKASIAISIEFSRVRDTETMVSVGYKIAAKAPARATTSVCRIGEGGLLRTNELEAQNRVLEFPAKREG